MSLETGMQAVIQMSIGVALLWVPFNEGMNQRLFFGVGALVCRLFPFLGTMYLQFGSYVIFWGSSRFPGSQGPPHLSKADQEVLFAQVSHQPSLQIPSAIRGRRAPKRRKQEPVGKQRGCGSPGVTSRGWKGLGGHSDLQGSSLGRQAEHLLTTCMGTCLLSPSLWWQCGDRPRSWDPPSAGPRFQGRSACGEGPQAKEGITELLGWKEGGVKINIRDFQSTDKSVLFSVINLQWQIIIHCLQGILGFFKVMQSTISGKNHRVHGWKKSTSEETDHS